MARGNSGAGATVASCRSVVAMGLGASRRCYADPVIRRQVRCPVRRAGPLCSAGMDEAERLTLEREVREHSDAVESLVGNLRELEAALAQLVEPHESLQREISILKSSIRSRMAAISIAEARLGVDPF